METTFVIELRNRGIFQVDVTSSDEVERMRECAPPRAISSLL